MNDHNWMEKRLGDIAFRHRDTVAPGQIENCAYIGLEHIAEGGLYLLGTGTSDDVKSVKSRFDSGQILFGKLRPYFRKIVQPTFGGVCSTDIWVISPTSGVDAGFLMYLLSSESFLEPVIRAAEGTKMPRAKWDFAENISLMVPPLVEQQAIASVLGALDKKMESNRIISTTSRNLYRAEIRKLLGQMPINGLGDKLGLSAVMSRCSERIADVDAPEYSATIFGLDPRDNRFKKTLSAGKQKNKKIKLGDLVFGFSRRTLSFGVMKDPIGSVSPVYEVFSVQGGLEVAEIIEMQIRDQMNEFMDILKPGAREGQPIEAEYLLKKKLILPYDPPSFRIPDELKNLAQIADTAISENRSLTSLRDTLLPELVSGRLRVKDAESMMENV